MATARVTETGATHLYYYVKIPVGEQEISWRTANAQATSHRCCVAQGHLVTISDVNEQDFVMNFVNKEQIWMGLTDVETENEWKWVDGTPANYFKWREGEPNNLNNEDCGFMTSDGVGGWSDYDCDRSPNPGYVVEFNCPQD
jgi:hypothetical protein